MRIKTRSKSRKNKNLIKSDFHIFNSSQKNVLKNGKKFNLNKSAFKNTVPSLIKSVYNNKYNENNNFMVNFFMNKITRNKQKSGFLVFWGLLEGTKRRRSTNHKRKFSNSYRMDPVVNGKPMGNTFKRKKMFGVGF